MIPIKVQIKGEPAVDTGRVLRKAFTDVFAELARGSSSLRYSEVSIVGKMIAYSLIQGGPGFPYLTPGIYWDIATGDLSEATGRSYFVDIGDR